MLMKHTFPSATSARQINWGGMVATNFISTASFPSVMVICLTSVFIWRQTKVTKSPNSMLIKVMDHLHHDRYQHRRLLQSFKNYWTFKPSSYVRTHYIRWKLTLISGMKMWLGFLQAFSKPHLSPLHTATRHSICGKGQSLLIYIQLY